MQTHISKTRSVQRTVTKYLKRLGFNASSERCKGDNGWQTNVGGVTVSRRVKSQCKSHSGRTVKVVSLSGSDDSQGV